MSQSLILSRLLDLLWAQYKSRVAYAAAYERMVEERGGRLQNDHIAFRTFNCPVGAQPPGVEGIARVFTALGYERKNKYLFEDKHLTAWHYEHKTDARNPKLFISQLEVGELPKPTAEIIKNAVADAPDPLSGKNIAALDAEALAAFFARPWRVPKRRDVLAADMDSQYAAWTLLHGNAVNHFTAYINEQHVKEWPDIETTVAALRAAGLPMKDEFEGERGTKLRQSSTKASTMDCDVVEDDGKSGKLNWSYAYYELAERGDVPGPGGKPVRFQGFLGAQATNLFEMTKHG
jgi:hypothetical protein